MIKNISRPMLKESTELHAFGHMRDRVLALFEGCDQRFTADEQFHDVDQASVGNIAFKSFIVEAVKIPSSAVRLSTKLFALPGGRRRSGGCSNEPTLACRK